MNIFISLVTFNSASDIAACISAICQLDFPGTIQISLIDNGSHDESVHKAVVAFDEYCSSKPSDKISLTTIPFEQNFGFSAAHNLNASRFLDSNEDYFIVLNPDVSLFPDALNEIISVSARYNNECLLTPKLLRKERTTLNNQSPLLDAAGMILNDELRHFDRGSNEVDVYNQEEFVFGGTGACLIFPRAILKKLLLKGEQRDKDIFKVFPQLEVLYNERVPLFDEGFFAYREDADLSWRAQHLEVKTVYAPTIRGTHIRHVLPSNRSEVSSVLNGLSVRNRFLLQINNYF